MTNPYPSSGSDDQQWGRRPATGAPTHPDGAPPGGGDPARHPTPAPQASAPQAPAPQAAPAQQEASAQQEAPRRTPDPGPQWGRAASALTWESWDPAPVPMWGPALEPWAEETAPMWAPAPAARWGPADQNSAPAAPASSWGPADQTQPGPADRVGPTGAPHRWWPPSRAVRIAAPAVALVALAAVLAFAWPGLLHPKVFDATTLQAGVTDVLRDSYQIDATNVTCPADQPVRAGTTFACSARVDGQARTVAITVRSGAGQVEVGRPR